MKLFETGRKRARLTDDSVFAREISPTVFNLIQGGETEEIRKQACIDMQKKWYDEQPYIMISSMCNFYAEYKGVDGLKWNPDTKFDWHRVTWEK